MFAKIQFSLKNSTFYHWQKHCHLFPLKWWAHFVCFQKNVCQIPKSPHPEFFIHCFNYKNAVPWKKQLISVWLNCLIAFRQYLLVCNRNTLWLLHILLYEGFKKTCTQGLRFSKMNNFYCFIKNILKWTWLPSPLPQLEYVVLKNTLGVQFGATCGLVWFLLRPQPCICLTIAFLTVQCQHCAKGK